MSANTNGHTSGNGKSNGNGHIAAEKDGYIATRHQREVGTGYFDAISEVITGGKASTLALEGSTEKAQF